MSIDQLAPLSDDAKHVLVTVAKGPDNRLHEETAQLSEALGRNFVGIRALSEWSVVAFSGDRSFCMIILDDDGPKIIGANP